MEFLSFPLPRSKGASDLSVFMVRSKEGERPGTTALCHLTGGKHPTEASSGGHAGPHHFCQCPGIRKCRIVRKADCGAPPYHAHQGMQVRDEAVLKCFQKSHTRVPTSPLLDHVSILRIY